MAIVNRFSFPGAVSAGIDVFVAGVGLFRSGIFDVLASDTSTLATVRGVVVPLGAVETANVDTTTAPAPAQTNDPYPNYLRLQDLIETIDDPTSETTNRLRAAYARKSSVDLRDYITTAVARTGRDPLYVFDVAAVIAAMESYRGACYVPPGDWQPNAYNVPLDDNVTAAAGSLYQFPKRQFVYRFWGAGHQSRLLFPAGMTASDYIFKANSSNANDFGTLPKVEIEGLTVAGADRPTVDPTTDARFILLNQRSITAKNIYFTGCKNPITATGYCDAVRLETVHATFMAPGSYVLDASTASGGDGWALDGVNCYETGGADIRTSRGVNVRNCVGGWYRLRDCVVTFEGNHFESMDVPYYRTGAAAFPVITLQGTVAHFLTGYYQLHTAFPLISIDDTLTTNRTQLYIKRGVRFIQRLDTPGSAYDSLLGTLVDIVNINSRGEVHLESPQVGLYPHASTITFGSPTAVVAAIVRASGDATMDAMLTAYQSRVMLGRDVQLKRHQNVWTLRPEGNEAMIPLTRISVQDTPNFTVAAVASDASNPYAPVLATGTYYYKAAIRDIGQFNSAASVERTLTTASGTPLPQFTINGWDSPVAITLWRGTSPGVYTHWARIYLPRDSGIFIDQGTTVGGVAWSTTSVPATPASNETVEGYLLLRGSGLGGTRRVVFVAGAPPTIGQYAQGDIAENTSVAAGGVPGWRCVAGGFPGTWKAMPAVAA